MSLSLATFPIVLAERLIGQQCQSVVSSSNESHYNYAHLLSP